MYVVDNVHSGPSMGSNVCTEYFLRSLQSINYNIINTIIATLVFHENGLISYSSCLLIFLSWISLCVYNNHALFHDTVSYPALDDSEMLHTRVRSLYRYLAASVSSSNEIFICFVQRSHSRLYPLPYFYL